VSRTIPLTRGFVTLVDEQDYEWLSQYSWHAAGTMPWIYAETERPDGNRVLMHRLLLDIVDKPSRVYGDHINGDGLDNRRRNLRVTDNKGNQGNRRGGVVGSVSKYRGVVYGKKSGKWLARLRVNRQLQHIGSFDNEEDAALAYDVVARLHFGEFWSLNLPERKQEHVSFFLDNFVPRTTLDPCRDVGVSEKIPGRWRAYVSEKGKHKHIGYYPSREEAKAARLEYLESQAS
jgi:hypothetical protein